MRDLKDEEKEILAHVVVDPDAWWAHVNSIEKLDAEKCLKDKCTRWKPAMEEHKKLHGDNYQTRAELDAVEKQINDQKIADAAQAAANMEAQKKKDFENAVSSKVNEILIEKGLIS